MPEVIFLEKFESCYNSFFYDSIAEAKYRIIKDGDEFLWHLRLYEFDEDNRTVIDCEETGKRYLFPTRLDYHNTSVLLNAFDTAILAML